MDRLFAVSLPKMGAVLAASVLLTACGGTTVPMTQQLMQSPPPPTTRVLADGVFSVGGAPVARDPAGFAFDGVVLDGFSGSLNLLFNENGPVPGDTFANVRAAINAVGDARYAFALGKNSSAGFFINDAGLRTTEGAFFERTGGREADVNLHPDQEIPRTGTATLTGDYRAYEREIGAATGSVDTFGYILGDASISVNLGSGVTSGAITNRVFYTEDYVITTRTYDDITIGAGNFAPDGTFVASATGGRDNAAILPLALSGTFQGLIAGQTDATQLGVAGIVTMERRTGAGAGLATYREVGAVGVSGTVNEGS